MGSKIKNILILCLFALSCCALFWLTGSRTPWTTFRVSAGKDSVSVFLGDVPVENYDRMGFTRAQIKFVGAEDAWLVGTDKGELFLIDMQGKQLWKRSLGIGKLVSLAVTADDRLAYAGESSAEGNLYAINVHTGDIEWKYKAADFVGTDASSRSYPAPVHIAVDGEGNAFVNMYRFVMQKNGSRGYDGRMIAVDAKGRLLWQFPENETIDSWINWCDVNDRSGRVVIATSAYDFRPEMKYKKTLYLLDKKTGTLLHDTFVPPVPPFDNTVMRGSPTFSEDGEYLAGMGSDGRGFLFDKSGKLLWWRFLSKPTKVDDSWINASGRDGYIVKEGAVFSTINTYNRENWQLPTPVEHPSNNSLFLFTLDGNFKYQYRAQGTIEEIAFSPGKAACAIGRNVRTHDYKAHGASVLNLADGKEEHFFHTEGPCQAVAISRDGAWLAGVEAPALTPEGKLIGSYRLHIWKLQKGS
ncbi:MAG: PQQ-like beta-propeller repeat protein [Acidaminococcaceae bacterium]|nr:PQQ-like beta-propeller repeat protein [Acidaminococcaceae bacterium]MBR2183771.1 PQQ-like beta-propeller repeat protein [Acidaminococcaceae bacterium]